MLSLLLFNMYMKPLGEIIYHHGLYISVRGELIVVLDIISHCLLLKYDIYHILLLYQPPYCLATSLPKLLEASQACQWSSASPGRFQSAGLDLRRSLEVHGHHDSHAPISVIHSRSYYT